MLGVELRRPGTGLGADPTLVARAFRERVLPCGIEPINRLERIVTAKHEETRRLSRAPAEELPSRLRRLLETVPATRPHRDGLLRETPPGTFREIVSATGGGRLGPRDLEEVAGRLSGAPLEVRRDLAAELIHASAPDRVALLARWVYHPARRTGVLCEFGGPPPEDYPAAQARLAEVRLELAELGFPSTTFAGVDVLLALTYAGRLQDAVDRSFQGGGIERLLPGPFPLATMILGVRRRFADADR